MSNLTDGQLRELRAEFGLRAFVETGSYLGDGIAAALRAGFESAWSCDILERHLDVAKARFIGDPRVRLFNLDSLSFLRQVAIHVPGPALFWLDAHFPSVYGAPEIEAAVGAFPLLTELRIIASGRPTIREDVVLADDLRVVNSPDNPRWRTGEIHAALMIEGLLIADLIEPFAVTHQAAMDHREEGILVITPRREVQTSSG